ncbi:hypothetical protein KC331_g21970, partial [Hortaea werneckii]
PTGKWGQIILMGRDYDCKYVISRSWSAFLATVADDMESGKAFIDEETNELKLREFKQQGVEPAYIDILRWRTDQKYGRKKPVRRPLRINSNVAGPSQNGLSPYQSPSSSAAAAADDRGRSPHRPSNGKQPATSSPRAHVSSPLARVAEEPQSQPATKPEAIGGSSSEEAMPQAKLVSVETPTVNNASSSSSSNNNKEKDLVSIDTPRQSDEQEAKRDSVPNKSGLGVSVESNPGEEKGEEVVDKSVVENPPQVEKNEEERGVEAAAKGGAETEDDGEMKDVKI